MKLSRLTFKRLFVLLGVMRVEDRRHIVGVDAKPEDVSRLPSGTQYRVLRELGPDYVPTDITGVVQRGLDRYRDNGQRLVKVFERTGPDDAGDYRVRGSWAVYITSDEPGVPRPAFRPLVPGIR